MKFLCGNKMPTRCNRGFYCRSYCLLKMFWAPLCPSSGAQEYYTVLLPVVFHAVVFKLLVWCGAEGYVSGLQDAALAVRSACVPTPHNCSQHIQANTKCSFIQSVLPTMGIMMPETC